MRNIDSKVSAILWNFPYVYSLWLDDAVWRHTLRSTLDKLTACSLTAPSIAKTKVKFLSSVAFASEKFHNKCLCTWFDTCFGRLHILTAISISGQKVYALTVSANGVSNELFLWRCLQDKQSKVFITKIDRVWVSKVDDEAQNYSTNVLYDFDCVASSRSMILFFSFSLNMMLGTILINVDFVTLFSIDSRLRRLGGKT